MFLNWNRPENPAYSCVFEPENIKIFEESESKIPSLSIHILPHLQKSKINLNLIDDALSLDITPWMLPKQIKKRYNQPGNVQTVLFTTSIQISFVRNFFMDGSKTEVGVAAVAVSTKHSRKPWLVAFWTTAPYILQNYELFFWL